MIQPVILCGGSGTRLWPLSRKAFPKQFVPLIGGKSLLALTLERVAALCKGPGHPGVLCVGAEDHRFLVNESLEAAGVQGTALLEPVARNTAAAMALAALQAAGPEQLLLFCPADHHIPDEAAFCEMVRNAARAARQPGTIVTFGVLPTFPSTGYGYIECGEPQGDTSHRVRRFIEKPNREFAQELILGGKVLWNAGIFLCSAGTLLEALAQHAPDILTRCQEAMSGRTHDGIFLRPAEAPLQACRSESIDYAVMERHDNVRVYPFRSAWSDVGSWNAVADMTEPDEQGNRIEGQGVAVDSRNVYIHAPHRRVVALGMEDVVIVDTPDAVLVTRRASAEQVKAVVAALEASQSPEAVSHRKVQRPWGSYDSIEAGPRFQVKRIVVKASASLSLQKHYHRAEHWIVVKGTAEVTRGKDTFLITENQSTYIPLGEVHRLHNPGKTPLEMIEVQSGSYLGEDDIVRLDDSYGRVVPIAGAKRIG
ncbi:mannose-1-phosphate guanylyltransferase/mannose-6-phosphate isomerase [Ramlibacter rhizophilus]|uniref:mannose-1-phosphate guanylyltransferase n=1 Tax=Ramlibacter rhizophilus TaxID=1781167 RepID=A0A4Z0BZV0_9BURK|nr:mannose-1-phosphate guanylyltransferase/mannose-6-phosphate isomerase [Ramlibacter rhizophilus]TFZ04202.1 mannose-1-phosphate guanylyltransferase/mannose-6-phosphate isomerase [Ramlibacter rhizophilus]